MTRPKQIEIEGGTDGDVLTLVSGKWEPAASSAVGGNPERSLVASIESTQEQTGFTTIGGCEINPSDLTFSTSTWEVVLKTDNASDAAEIRLRNVTLGTTIASSTLSTTSLNSVLVSVTVTLTSGSNIYEAQLRLQTTGSPNRAFCSQARLIFDA